MYRTHLKRFVLFVSRQAKHSGFSAVGLASFSLSEAAITFPAVELLNMLFSEKFIVGSFILSPSPIPHRLLWYKNNVHYIYLLHLQGVYTGPKTTADLLIPGALQNSDACSLVRGVIRRFPPQAIYRFVTTIINMVNTHLMILFLYLLQRRLCCPWYN